MSTNPTCFSTKPHLINVYVKLQRVYPCVPQELILRQYTGSYGLSDQSPSSLVETVFPVTAFSAPEGFSEVALDTLKKSKSMRLPPIPRENIKADFAVRRSVQSGAAFRSTAAKTAYVRGVDSMFSFLQLTQSCIVAASRIQTVSSVSDAAFTASMGMPASGIEESQLAVGYNTGAVVVWHLKQYSAYIDALRSDASKEEKILAAASRDPTTTSTSCTAGPEALLSLGYSTSPQWGSSRPPEGVELLGYHSNGSVMSVSHDPCTDVVLSGSADGAIYLWDVHNRYGTSKGAHCLLDEGASSTDEYAAAVRRRRLIRVVAGAHSGPVSCLETHGGVIITGGSDKTVRLWHSTRTETTVLLAAVQSFQMHGWVKSIYAAPVVGGIQLDDVIVTDDTGLMMGIKARTAKQQQCHHLAGTGASGQPAGAKGRSSQKKPTSTAHTIRPSTVGIIASRSEPTVVMGKQDMASTGNYFSTSRTHMLLSEESIRVSTRHRNECPEEHSNTMLRLFPILNFGLALCISYSPHLRILDYTKLKTCLKLSHPSLTATGSEIAAKEASSVYRQEEERRAAVFDERKCELQSIEHRLTSNYHAVSEPLRFIDALYVTSSDVVLLLDSRNTVLVWERSNNKFSASVSTGMFNRDGQQKRAFALLPCGTAHYTMDQRNRKQSLLDVTGAHGEDFCIPFFVVCNTGIELFHVVPTDNPVLEVVAHSTPVVGLSYMQSADDWWSTSIGSDDSVVARLAREGTPSLASASQSGQIKCWGAQLQCLRDYHPRRAQIPCGVVVERGGASTSLERGPSSTKRERPFLRSLEASLSEVTCFHYSARWGSLALTGHENGDLCIWKCKSELSDVVLHKSLHTNSISGIAEGFTRLHKPLMPDAREEMLITVGFDGHLALWGYPERCCATPKGRRRVMWNELLCVGFCDFSGLIAAGDSEGTLFVLSVKDLSPVYACPLNPPRACTDVVMAGSHQEADAVRKLSSTNDVSHTSAITALCIADDAIVTGDDEGHLILWDMKGGYTRYLLLHSICETHVISPSYGTGVRHSRVAHQLQSNTLDNVCCCGSVSHDDENSLRRESKDVSCITHVEGKCIVVGTRSGRLFLYNVNKCRHPIGTYVHYSEVTSLAVDCASVGDGTFSFAVGSADGSIMLLASQCFQSECT